jgi:hypothetical protein
MKYSFVVGRKLNKMHGFRTPLNISAHLRFKNRQSRKKSCAGHYLQPVKIV